MDRYLEIEPLEPDKLIKVNDLKEITNSIYFSSTGIPTDDGLLSNEIFGITKEERANIFAYIDLSDWFLHPFAYKIWNSIDGRVRDIVHGKRIVSLDAKGNIVDDENGKTGINFLKQNIDKIKFKTTTSIKNNDKVAYLNKFRDKLFIKQMIVIPAYYRDVNNNGHYVSLGDVNKLYDNLIMAVKSKKETQDFGISLSDATNGRIQETLLAIYQWFVDGSMPGNADSNGTGMSKKYGILRRANMSKTADYASRLVLSAPDLRVEHVDDMMVNLDYSAVPLASLCSNVYPFIIFYLRRFFENEFSGTASYPMIDKDGSIKNVQIKDPLEQFSDARLKKEIDRFCHGYSNRFIPVEVESVEGYKIHMRFVGRHINERLNELDVSDAEKLDKELTGKSSIVDRDLTWCDLIFRAAKEAVKGKYVLITRYPMDTYFNQFPTLVEVSSTVETEPMVIGNEYYKFYPKIRQEDIGTNTSSSFVDTLRICNLYLEGIVGDYDGDQCTAKIAFTDESNAELKEYSNSKAHYISLGGMNIRTSAKEAIESAYALTLALPETEKQLGVPEF